MIWLSRISVCVLCQLLCCLPISRAYFAKCSLPNVCCVVCIAIRYSICLFNRLRVVDQSISLIEWEGEREKEKMTKCDTQKENESKATYVHKCTLVQHSVMLDGCFKEEIFSLIRHACIESHLKLSSLFLFLCGCWTENAKKYTHKQTLYSFQIFSSITEDAFFTSFPYSILHMGFHMFPLCCGRKIWH